ncbi:MAG: 3-deoxy-D-manno-octulosonic acid transferase [Nitrospirae bacterium]|nr:3-deoxy-D-manno-octulosonic acid transferase [Nitrospirota bacterium]
MPSLRFFMLYWLYSILYAAALAVLLPFQYFKRSGPLRKRWLHERFGFYAGQHSSRHLWIHAVSVGEVIAAVPLIEKIKQRHPSLRIIISTVTDTGQKIARDKAGAYAEIIYVPFDLPFAVRNALHHIRPFAFVIMETELWPCVIKMLKESNVPVILMNGRLSERSYNRYRKSIFFIGDVLRNINLLCVQDDNYAGRFTALGAMPERIKVIGSFKFDTRPSSDVPQWAETLCRPVIIAASTHETEEDLVLDAFVQLKEVIPGLNLIIAPRHPERFSSVETLVKKKGLECLKRSEFANGREETQIRGKSGVVVLLDVMGELSAVYGAVDIAIMGGSFIKHGGQNPLEAAFWGKAIVCGPHMENFYFIEEFYSRGGAVSAEGRLLYSVLKEMLASPGEVQRMGNIAKEIFEKNSGATDRAMELIEQYLIK